MSRYLNRKSKGIVISPDPRYFRRNVFAGGRGTLCKTPEEAWKLDIGAECNLLLELAEDIEKNVNGTSTKNQQLIKALRSMVKRTKETLQLELEAA